MILALKIKSKKILKRAGLFAVLLTYVVSQNMVTVSALTEAQLDVFQHNIHHFNVTACDSTLDGVVGGSSEGGPLTGVRFPKVADKAVLAKAIDEYIKKDWPKSPLVGYGDKFVSNGEKYDVNPLISVVIAQVEYQFGTLTKYVGPGAPGHNNFWAVTHGGSGVRFGAYPSIDIAMEEHFALLGGKRKPSYIGPPQNFTTIKQIMNQYAPSFENDTPGYINTIIAGMKKIVDGGTVGADTAAATTAAAPAAEESPSSISCKCSTGQDPIPASTVSAPLDTALKELAKDNGGKTSISVSSVDGKTKGHANGSEQMPTRSSYKVYTAYATLKAIEANKLGWDSTVRKESGNPGAFTSGTVERAMELMIVNSDNAAASALRTDSRIGSAARVTSLLQDAGLTEKTVMGSGSSGDAQSGTNSKSTANDFVRFLSLLHQKKLPGVTNEAYYDKLIGYMKKATSDGGSARSGIVAGVGGTEVANKPGWSGSGDTASNDVGIVYLKDKPYVVAILTDAPYKWVGVAKIAKAVHATMGGASASGEDACGSTGGTGDLSSTLKSYVWPTYSANRKDPKPEYKKAFDSAVSKGQYPGGGYTDCGAFVTRAMIDSGFEPNYNYAGKVKDGAANTWAGQEPWLKANWKKISVSSTKDLQPGDVAISYTHTYLYTGKIEGLSDVFASASWKGHVPVSGQPGAPGGNMNWYRK